MENNKLSNPDGIPAVYRSDEAAFTEQETLRHLGAIGVANVKRENMPGAFISGHFDHGNDSVLVELKSDLQSLVISDCSPAGMEFAVRLQNSMADPLRMVDEGYSFDLELKEFTSADELEAATRAA